MIDKPLDLVQELAPDTEPGEQTPRSDVTHTLHGATRRQVLATLAIAYAGAIVGSGKQPAPIAQQVSPEQQREPEYIKLGDIKFVFIQGPNLPAEIKSQVSAYLKRGYEKLLTYFGPEIIKMTEELVFPVVVDPRLFEHEGVEARTLWKNKEINSPDTGEPEAVGEPDPDVLIVGNIDEGVMFHELFHIYVQKADMNISSTSFLEGHGHAIHRTFFEHDTAIYGKLDQIPEIRELFASGVDYTTYDAMRGGGIQDIHLKNMALVNWQNRWLEYLKRNPNFLKDFYKEVTKQRAAGKKYFFKKDLVEIAAKVDPKFMQWYNTKGSSLKNIGETGQSSTVKAFRIPTLNAVVLANFVVTQEVKGKDRKPGKVSPAKSGKVRLSKTVPSTGEILFGNAILAQDAPCFMFSKATDAIVNDPDMYVMIGGAELVKAELVSPE